MIKRSQACLYYVHDPMCSWCWGFAPTWAQIRERLPRTLPVTYVLGGLAPDTDSPMPLTMRETLRQTWHSIADRLGTQFNFDFWTACQPRRSTYPACRAVIAADNQHAGELMITAIQHAYYLQARNPSDASTLRALAAELGLNTDRFSNDLNSPNTHQTLSAQVAMAQRLGANGFPSLVFSDAAGSRLIHHDYADPGVTLAAVDQQLRRTPSRLMAKPLRHNP